MRRSLTLVATLALALNSVGPVTAAVTIRDSLNSELQGQTEPSLDDLYNATRIRKAAGLDYDAQLVQRSFLDSLGFPSTKFGAPLSDNEAAEMERRLDIQMGLGPARAVAADIPSAAGTFLDQTRRGLPVFLFAGDPEQYRGELEQALPPGTAFELRSVSRTSTDLLAVQSLIEASKADLAKDGINVTLTGIDATTNTVVIGVEGLTDASQAELTDRYGSAVQVRSERGHDADACNSRVDCAPLKGGLDIESAANGSHCTSGYIGKIVGTSTLRVLTAGHCIELNGGLNVNWKHHAVTFGQSKTETWYSGTTGDAGLISVSLAGTRNQFYAADHNDIRALTNVFGTGEQQIGDFLCRGGRTSGYDCGYIRVTGVARDVDGKTVYNSIEVDFDSSPGDSGGPMFWGSNAYGIHTDSEDDSNPLPRYGWYSPIHAIHNELIQSKAISFGLCLNSTCSTVGWN